MNDKSSVQPAQECFGDATSVITTELEFIALIKRKMPWLLEYAASGRLSETERAKVEALLAWGELKTMQVFPDGTNAAQLREEVMRLGCVAVLDIGPARGGDFTSNHSHGAWAENLLVAAEPARILPFGPSDGVAPGDLDYESSRISYREVAVLDGKRPEVAPGNWAGG